MNPLEPSRSSRPLRGLLPLAAWLVLAPFPASGQGLQDDADVEWLSAEFSTPAAFAENTFGLNPESEEVRDFARTWSLRQHLPDPGDQGDNNSCVSWTCCYGLLSYLARDHFDPPQVVPCEPMFMHHWLVMEGRSIPDLVRNGIQDRYTKFSAAFRCIEEHGGLEFGQHPDFKIFPDTDTLNRAAIRKISLNRKRIGTENIVFDIKKEIWKQRQPVPAGFRVDESFRNVQGPAFEQRTRTVPPETPAADPETVLVWRGTGAAGERIDKHAMLIIGYDDSISAFEVMNSWGTDWGNEGYIWVDYKFLADQGGDTDSFQDNPCCIYAFRYVIEKPLEDPDTGWARLVDPAGHINFAGITDPEKVTRGQVLELKPNPGQLAIRKAVVPLPGAGGHAILTAYGTIASIKTGDKLQVLDMQVVKGIAGATQYWIKGKRVGHQP